PARWIDVLAATHRADAQQLGGTYDAVRLVRVPRSVKLTDMLRWREGLCVCPDEHAPKRRADVIGIFPNEASVTRLIGAVLLEQNDEWLLQCRYMQIEGMAELTPLLIDADPAKIPPMAT